MGMTGVVGHAVGCLRARPRIVGVLVSSGCRAPRIILDRNVLWGDWLLFENCTVDASICGQVFKGTRWMPWHQEPMKDVGGRDRPRGVVNRAVIRGCPNGETRQSSWAVTCT
jgi:hypothetical protein